MDNAKHHGSPETIGAIEAGYSANAQKPITLEGLARQWLEFANEIREGYWGTIDDFTNDLTGRDLLEEAARRLGEGERAWLDGLTRPGDEAYRAATAEDSSDRLSRFFRHDNYWWWHRLPLVPGQLAADLGVLDA
jgi:hypothetical protein